MSFTNNYDVTSPPDTQVANTYGAVQRAGMRLDLQQRLGSISGLDASQPTFSSDIQPANWNGLLFFSTDVGRTYQFTSPNFVDITLAIKYRGYKAQTITTYSNITTQQTPYTITIPAGVIGVSTRMRVTVLSNTTVNFGNPSVILNFGGQQIGGLIVPSSPPLKLVAEGGNFGSATAQSWINREFNPGFASSYGNPVSTTVNTALAQSFTTVYNPSDARNVTTFYGMLVELG